MIPYLGMIPPTDRDFARNIAHRIGFAGQGLAMRSIGCSVRYVVAALPQGAETYRLNRYPSPDGRPYAGMHGPPTFLPLTRLSGRKVAHYQRVTAVRLKDLGLRFEPGRTCQSLKSTFGFWKGHDTCDYYAISVRRWDSLSFFGLSLSLWLARDAVADAA